MNEQQIREAILDVIDAGCTCDSGAKHPWEFYEYEAGDEPLTEDMANEQRLRFCGAVIAKLGGNGIVHGMGPIDNTPMANMIPVDAVLSQSIRKTDNE